GGRGPLPGLAWGRPRGGAAPDPRGRRPGGHAHPREPRREQDRAMVLAPSILSADFARLADAIARAERGGAGVIHVDVMDGHFVPNITLGPPVVKSIRKATTLTLDCHLLIGNVD